MNLDMMPFMKVIFPIAYYMAFFNLIVIIVGLIVNFKNIISYFKKRITKQGIITLLVIIIIGVYFRVNHSGPAFGFGNNIDESLTGYSLYQSKYWQRCQSGSLINCTIYNPPSYPIGHAFFMSLLYDIFGYPLNYEDWLLSVAFSILSIIVIFAFVTFLFDSSKTGLISAFIFSMFPLQIAMTYSKETAVFNLFFIMLSQLCLLVFFRLKTIESGILALFTLAFSFLIRPNTIITVTFISIILYFFFGRTVKIKMSIPLRQKIIFIAVIFIGIILILSSMISSYFIGQLHLGSEFTSPMGTFFFSQIRNYLILILNPYIFFLLVFAAIGLFSKFKLTSKYLLLWYIFSILTIFVYSADETTPSRYLIETYLPIILLASSGITILIDKINKRLWKNSAMVFLLLIYVFFISKNLYYMHQDYSWQYSMNDIIKGLKKESSILGTLPIETRFLIIHGFSSKWLISEAQIKDYNYFLENKYICGSNNQSAFIDVTVVQPVCRDFKAKNALKKIEETADYALYVEKIS